MLDTILSEPMVALLRTCQLACKIDDVSFKYEMRGNKSDIDGEMALAHKN